MDTSPGISLDQLKNYEKLHEQWYGLANGDLVKYPD